MVQALGAINILPLWGKALLAVVSLRFKESAQHAKAAQDSL